MDPNSEVLRQVVLIDTMASRYGILPSQILANADTFDVFVIQAATSWIEYQQTAAKAKAEGRAPPPSRKLTQQQMEEMIRKARSK